MQYKLKYEDKKWVNESSLATVLGTTCHYVLEQKCIQLKQQKIDYEHLKNILINGYIENNDDSNGKPKENIVGVSQLKKDYLEDWFSPDNASGMNYNEKIEVFNKVLQDEMIQDMGDWRPMYSEYNFEFVYDNKIIIHGFIDRIDIKEDDDQISYRVIDYKTSKKIFDSKALPTSQQFGIYALAILNDFGTLPIESIYRFILIDEKQYALTKGWEGRLVKSLDKMVEEINSHKEDGKWFPSPSPLCYWCFACENNPTASKYKKECQYYSLWTPNNKVYDVNKTYNKEKEDTEKKRKLVF